MTDDIRVLSEALAIDPASTVFVQLGELLRQRGDLDLAYRIAVRGLERHQQRADAHDLVARIASDRGDLERAKAEWEAVLILSPGHAAAHKGLGFLCYRNGDRETAGKHFDRALAADPSDATLATALRTVRGEPGTGRSARVPTPPIGAPHAAPPHAAPPLAAIRPADPRTLFADVLGGAARTVLLLDGDGYVVAGAHAADGSEDRSALIGAQLSGVSEEADRAMRHLGLGRWSQIVFEAESASVAMAPARSGVVLVAAPRSVPLGLVRRILEQALERARRWLEHGA
ncbi:MAG TPA: tetratricopeptide repeat protein [Gemmatimonadaceae bacterium]|nr:tetratricopeptide repeat protein [Gemmatimonadaceae bacterium]